MVTSEVGVPRGVRPRAVAEERRLQGLGPTPLGRNHWMAAVAAVASQNHPIIISLLWRLLLLVLLLLLLLALLLVPLLILVILLLLLLMLLLLLLLRGCCCCPRPARPNLLRHLRLLLPLLLLPLLLLFVVASFSFGCVEVATHLRFLEEIIHQSLDSCVLISNPGSPPAVVSPPEMEAQPAATSSRPNKYVCGAY